MARPPPPGVRSATVGSAGTWSASSDFDSMTRMRGRRADVSVPAPVWADSVSLDEDDDMSRSGDIPSDPAALRRLLSRLGQRFPTLQIPSEVRRAAYDPRPHPQLSPPPPHDALPQGPRPCPTPADRRNAPLPPPPPIPPPPPPRCSLSADREPSGTADSRATAQAGPVMGTHGHRPVLESSCDAESMRTGPQTPPHAMPRHGLGWLADRDPEMMAALKQQEQMLAAEQRLISELLRSQGSDGEYVAGWRGPASATPALPDEAPRQSCPPPNHPAPADAAEQTDATPRRGFYDRLGRQLTELLLQAGMPLPRFPLRAEQADARTQTRKGDAGDGSSASCADDDEDALLDRAQAAAEMFLRDYYDHKKALAEAETKLAESDNENLALRSQLDLSIVKMVAAQKELDKYASYFSAARPDAQWPGEQPEQVRALLRKLQQMGSELQSMHSERQRLLMDERKRVDDAVSKALQDRDAEVAQLRARLRERKRVVKDMKLMLHTHLANADPSDTTPRLAFADVVGPPHQPDASVSAAIALP
eukprot:TRINITY_DN2213_c1_g3_i1.p1 TRINITY_DN2213_c1_g3~~TRINITY_DN2213_c1_g3_i1.p1  ORF type:complete len:535 (+),score=198.29 TRINITY_DN2213_c1_g3_i1:149-1753(+)